MHPLHQISKGHLDHTTGLYAVQEDRNGISLYHHAQKRIKVHGGYKRLQAQVIKNVAGMRFRDKSKVWHPYAVHVS